MESSSIAKKVGLFAFIGLVIIGFLLVNFSRGAAFWKPHYTISVRAEGVGGLKRGAFVLMSGVQVGTVEDLVLSDDGRSVLIDCSIEKRYEIHLDARFEIEQSGFLGDQYVSVTPTANLAPLMKDGSSVIAAKPFNLQEAARKAVGLMERLDGAAAKLDSAVGRVDKILLSQAVLSDLTNTVLNVRHITERTEVAVQHVDDLIMINSPMVNASLSNVTAFTGRMNDFSTHLEGLTKQLTGVASNADAIISANRGDLTAAVGNIRAVTTDLKGLTADLQAGKGLVGGLLKDEQMHAQVAEMISNFGVLSSNLSRNGILWKPRNLAPLTNELRYRGRTPFK
jgi:phospholipid/cholesterol/gamma-HCH transport system substrate-binding protein